MSREALVFCLVVGAALLALWIEVRFTSRHAWSWGVVAFHLLAALVVLSATPHLMDALFAKSESPARLMLALFGLFLPALVYAFTAAVWTLKRVQQELGPR